ncbi:MAG: lycopene beta-cyclase [Bradymonadia bacterium]|jgi:lycopene beta-cyclase
MQTQYDVVIAGAGMAGLSAARALVSRWPDTRKILVVDPHLGCVRDKTISLWGDVPEWLKPELMHTWASLAVRFPGWSRSDSLGNQAYHAISAASFTRRALDRLRAAPNVDLVRSWAEVTLDEPDGAVLRVGSRTVRADHVLRGFGPKRATAPGRAPLLQHFGGWEITTPGPSFDPACATLMDFTVPQRDGPTFLYVLPFSPCRALVEYTVYSPTPLTRADYDAALADVLRKRVGTYQRVRGEYGVLPLHSTPGPRHHRVVDIGAGSGMIRPSTGYAFRRTLEQVEAVVQGLVTDGVPGARRRTALRHRVYDHLMLAALREQGPDGWRMFSRLFAHNPVGDVLRFMGEQTGAFEELRMFARLPLGPMLRGIVPAMRGGAGISAAA